MFSLKQVLFVSLPIAMSIGTIPAISIGTGTATARVPISNRDRAYTVDHTSNPVSVINPAPFDAQIKNNTLAISPDQTLGLVAYSDTPRVEVINLVNDKKRRQLDGFITPRSIVFSPNGKSIYISDSSTGLVTVLDGKTLVERNRIAVGPGAFGLALSPDGQKLYVNNEAASTVTVIDTAQSRPVKVIAGFSGPRQGIIISEDGTKVYVTNFSNDRVTVLDAATNKIEREITGFKKIRAIRLTKDGQTLYAANSGADEIAVVDVGMGGIVATIPVGREPYGVTLSPDGKVLYASNKVDNTIHVIDTATRRRLSVIGGFNEPRQAVVFSKDGQQAYVLNRDLSVSVVDTRRGKISHTLNAPFASAMAQKRWQAIARGDLAVVMAGYGVNPVLHWVGGPLNGDYTGIEAINTVWSKFTKAQAPLKVQVNNLQEIAGPGGSRIVTADTIFSNGKAMIPVTYRLVFVEGKVTEETWQIASRFWL
jgi:YVTN family beta-propeller protein